MSLTSDEKAGLNVALNEARLLAVDIEEPERKASLLVEVLTLPRTGSPPQDHRLQICLQPVRRIAGRLLSSNQTVERIPLRDLGEVVTSFAGQPIYGWEFFDPPDATALERLSLDVSWSSTGEEDVLHVFQEDPTRGLDIWLWFDRIRFMRLAGTEVLLEEVIAGGKRWWDGLFAGDPRTATAGMYPLKTTDRR